MSPFDVVLTHQRSADRTRCCCGWTNRIRYITESAMAEHLVAEMDKAGFIKWPRRRCQVSRCGCTAVGEAVVTLTTNGEPSVIRVCRRHIALAHPATLEDQ